MSPAARRLILDIAGIMALPLMTASACWISAAGFAIVECRTFRGEIWADCRPAGTDA